MLQHLYMHVPQIPIEYKAGRMEIRFIRIDGKIYVLSGNQTLIFRLVVV
jgi:hypothetical protein